MRVPSVKSGEFASSPLERGVGTERLHGGVGKRALRVSPLTDRSV
jgi:hypothetical protein